MQIVMLMLVNLSRCVWMVCDLMQMVAVRGKFIPIWANRGLIAVRNMGIVLYQ